MALKNSFITSLQMNYLSINILIIILSLSSCVGKDAEQHSKFTLEIIENCTDSLVLLSNVQGTYYHCGIGVTYDLIYMDQENILCADLYDFEFQYKPSKKIPIARFEFVKHKSYLILNTVEYLNEHYDGEFIYLLSKLRKGKYIKIE